MFVIHVKNFSVMLAVPSDERQLWLKHVKAIVYILILNLLHLVNLATHSVNNNLIIAFHLISS
jgi:hypothetical protein